ncbi:MAG: RluA family pseudouridine synthase [Crocinitomicaceae bacterium]|nr:RluA family pseudouridine synthase [Crocinitomicaceae bacterium]
MKYHVKKNSSLLDFLKIHYAGASNSTIKSYFKNEQIKINNVLAKSQEDQLKQGDVVEVLKEGEKSKVKLPFKLVYEDDAILVVEKVAGVLTSGEGITKRPTLHKLVDTYLQAKSKGKIKAHVVHRLDKEVIGLVLFAKSEKIVEVLQTNWKKYTKKYLALTRTKPEKPSGTIDTWLIERSLKMNVIPAEIPGAVHAITHYKWLRFEKKNSLIEVTLDTGKKNQIRVHLSHIGCPIIGDEKYGDTTKSQVRLMGFFLEILHPVTGKKVSWKLEPERSFLLA